MAIDPGGTTGVAHCFFEGGIPTSLDQFEFKSYEIGPEEHHEELWHTLGYWNLTDLVCESFEFRQHIDKDKAKTKVELISKEYIGVVKLFAEVRSIPLAMFTASAAKGFIPDTGPQKDLRIKQLGWLWNTPGNHANDATRHLLYYIVRKLKVRSPFLDIWLKD